MKRLFITAGLVLALLAPAGLATAHTAGHGTCEYAHARQSDGGGWAHSTRVFNNEFGTPFTTTVSKTHYQWTGPPSGGYWKIREITQRLDCAWWYL